jgi:hypothetical protein
MEQVKKAAEDSMELYVYKMNSKRKTGEKILRLIQA